MNSLVQIKKIAIKKGKISVGEIKVKAYFEIRYRPDRRIMVKENCGFYDVICEDLVTHRFKVTAKSKAVIEAVFPDYKSAMIAALQVALSDLAG